MFPGGYAANLRRGYSTCERDEESWLPHMDWAASFGDGSRLCPSACLASASRVELLLSASFVPRSYLRPWLMTWKKWCLCCSVSWRRYFHLASLIWCNIWYCTSRMKHKWGACVGPLVLSNWEISKDSLKKCRNKEKIEASIAEAYILEEVSNFTEKYYVENLPSVHNPPPRYNASENESNLTLF